MIGCITGLLAKKAPPQVLIDVNGVGYEIDVPMSTLYQLPPEGQSVTLVTHLAIKEDAHTLYGFASSTERAAFRELLKVSGIGARTALAILSGLSVPEIAQAIAAQDDVRFTRIPGIGKKTAERLLLDLRGKFDKILGPGQLTLQTDHLSGIRSALAALGYAEKDIQTAVKTLPADVTEVDGIRLSLKVLTKN